MIYLKENIRFLRKKHNLTQDTFANMLEIKRSLIGSYEEGRGVPKLEIIQRMADIFKVSLDELLSYDLSNTDKTYTESKHSLKILSITVTPENEERTALVPLKASAGYLNGRSDPEYMEQLPNFSMPVPELSKGKTYRVFQIKGDSMLPVSPGSYIFCDYIEEIADLRDGKPYIVITQNDGIVYKRVYVENNNELLLKSDNPDYAPYAIKSSSVLEIWRALGFLSFDLPDSGITHVQTLSSAVLKLQDEMLRLKSGK